MHENKDNLENIKKKDRLNTRRITVLFDLCHLSFVYTSLDL